jgi:glyoxylase I family protein
MMKIEHIGYMVENPAEVAAWYVKNLGFKIKRKPGGTPDPHFLADSSGQVMIEIYNNPQATVPDYALMDPLVLHLALIVEDDVDSVKQSLLAAGASIASDTMVTPAGDRLAMLRDPWGLAIQLCKRKEPMV